MGPGTRWPATATGLEIRCPVVDLVGVQQTPWTDASEVAPGDILADTTPQPVRGVPGRYATVIPDAWRIVYAFGGTTMAASIRAAVEHLERADLDLVGAEATYCEAIPCGPVAMQVEVLRDGRNGAQALVRCWSLAPGESPDGEVRNDLVVAVVLGRRRDSALSFPASRAPEVPDPLDCPARSTAEDSPFARIPYHHQTEFRMASGNVDWSERTPPGDPEAASWFRFVRSPMTAEGIWEPALLAVPGDVLGVAVHAGVGGTSGFFFVISLQIGLKFVDDLRTEWVLQHSRAQSANHGFASGTAELYDSDRSLVAVATQTALLRPMAADPGATDA